jgi:hypothetical protein
MVVVTDVLDGKYEHRIQNRGGRGDFIALPTWRSYLSSGGTLCVGNVRIVP